MRLACAEEVQGVVSELPIIPIRLQQRLHGRVCPAGRDPGVCLLPTDRGRRRRPPINRHPSAHKTPTPPRPPIKSSSATVSSAARREVCQVVTSASATSSRCGRFVAVSVLADLGAVVPCHPTSWQQESTGESIRRTESGALCCPPDRTGQACQIQPPSPKPPPDPLLALPPSLAQLPLRDRQQACSVHRLQGTRWVPAGCWVFARRAASPCGEDPSCRDLLSCARRHMMAGPPPSPNLAHHVSCPQWLQVGTDAPQAAPQDAPREAHAPRHAPQGQTTRGQAFPV